MEKAGDSIQKLVVKSNPLFKDKNCNDPKCTVCLSGCKVKCRARYIVSDNYCEHYSTCQGKYDGETADPIKERFTEHLGDYRLRPQKSSMYSPRSHQCTSPQVINVRPHKSSMCAHTSHQLYSHSMEKHNEEKVNFKVKVKQLQFETQSQQ